MVIAVRVAEEIATIRMLWGGHMIIIRSGSKNKLLIIGTLSLAYSLTFIGYEEDKTFPCSSTHGNHIKY